nr:zinc finger MYM-type protein 1-like [Setaria viridis]
MLDWYRKKDPKAALVTGENAPGNNQMSCPKIQKDLVRACAEETSELIKNEIGDRWFAVLVDEARDASIKEQMVVVVRFVNDKGSVIERFLGLQHVSDTTSSSLKGALVSMLAKYGLSIAKVRGQGYDGASNMRGQFHGLQRLVLNENPFAFYIHCFAHQLQLVVVGVARCCASTDDFFNYVTSVVNTVSVSCKRKDQLLQKQHDILVQQLDSGEISPGRGKNQETSLARLGDTRWGTHHKTLVRLLHMWGTCA